MVNSVLLILIMIILFYILFKYVIWYNKRYEYYELEPGAKIRRPTDQFLQEQKKAFQYTRYVCTIIFITIMIFGLIFLQSLP